MTTYQALINLSVPRRGDKDKQTDIVHAGETVELDDDLAAQFLRHDDRSGRQVDVRLNWSRSLRATIGPLAVQN